jgi:hypothetical protein
MNELTEKREEGNRDERGTDLGEDGKANPSHLPGMR